VKAYRLREVAPALALFYVLGLLLNAEGLSNWAARLRVSEGATVLRHVTSEWAVLTTSVGLSWPQRRLSDGFLAFAGARPSAPERVSGSQRERDKGARAAKTARKAKGASKSAPSLAARAPEVMAPPTLSPVARTEKEREMFDGAAIDDAVKGPKVLVLGDSIMITVGPVLRSEVEAKLGGSAVLKAKLATGLARPDVFDWTKELRRYTSLRRYDAMVVMLGTNDSQDFADGDDILAYGTSAWTRVYSRRLDDLMSAACAGADHVLWLGLPPMRSPAFNRKATRLNTWVKKLAVNHACVEFVPLDDAIGDDKGRYVTYRKVDRRLEKVRMTDGIHVTTKGGELVARIVVPRLANEKRAEAH
jgi:hypothetical protein